MSEPKPEATEHIWPNLDSLEEMAANLSGFYDDHDQTMYGNHEIATVLFWAANEIKRLQSWDPNSAAEIARLNWVLAQIDEVLEDG